MFDTNILIFNVIFTSFGLGYFLYAKKNKKAISLLSWIILMIYPYFITDLFYLIWIGVILLVLPFIIKV